MYRKRFGLTGHPLPRDTQGKTFYDGGESYAGLQRVFRWLADDPGLGVLVGEAGVGKTAAIRNLAAQLPRPENKVVYVCDTAVTPAAVYRNLAAELGLQPAYRRDALWRQLKKTIGHMVDSEGVIPMLILDSCAAPGNVEWPRRGHEMAGNRGRRLHITRRSQSASSHARMDASECHATMSGPTSPIGPALSRAARFVSRSTTA